MPYALRSAGNGKAFVVTRATGRKMSRRPLTVGRAKAQLRALYANTKEKL